MKIKDIFGNTSHFPIFLQKGSYAKEDAEGFLHSDDGPALHIGKSQSWFHHGKRHREDGPAYINGGIERFYLDNMEMNRFNYHKIMSKISGNLKEETCQK